MNPSQKRKLAPVKSAKSAHGSADISDEVRGRLRNLELDLRDLGQQAFKSTHEIKQQPPPHRDYVFVEKASNKWTTSHASADRTPTASGLGQLPERDQDQQTDPDADADADVASRRRLLREVKERTVTRDGPEYQNTEREETPGDPTGQAMASCLFPWCKACGSLFVFMSHERDLPRQLVTTSQVKDAVVFFLCGVCKRNRNEVAMEAPATGLHGWDRDRSGTAEIDNEAIDVHPSAWAGTEACVAARAMIGRAVEVLGNGKSQTASVDGLEALRMVQPGDIAGKVDMVGFRNGMKGMRLLRHFTGGYI